MPKLAIDVNVVLTWLGFQNLAQQETATRLFAELVGGKIEVTAMT